MIVRVFRPWFRATVEIPEAVIEGFNKKTKVLGSSEFYRLCREDWDDLLANSLEVHCLKRQMSFWQWKPSCFWSLVRLVGHASDGEPSALPRRAGASLLARGRSPVWATLNPDFRRGRR
jgi:hypothetical protein